MSVTAVVLILISAVTHAEWNILAKGYRPSAAFFFLTSLFGAILFCPILGIFNRSLISIPPTVWFLLIFSGMFEAIQFVGLAYAYQKTEVSLVYPIARSLPALLVPFFFFLQGRSGVISSIYFLGAGMIVIGCILLPLDKLRSLRLKRYLTTGFLFSLMAAVGTAGYSIMDDHALAVLRQITPFSAVSAGLIYIVLETSATCLWLGIFTAVRKAERQIVRRLLHQFPVRVMIVAVGIAVTYSIILVTYAYVKNVSYAVSFRQLSIPLGAIAGILFLRESSFPPKWIAIILITGGAVLVALGK